MAIYIANLLLIWVYSLLYNYLYIKVMTKRSKESAYFLSKLAINTNPFPAALFGWSRY